MRHGNLGAQDCLDDVDFVPSRALVSSMLGSESIGQRHFPEEPAKERLDLSLTLSPPFSAGKPDFAARRPQRLSGKTALDVDLPE
ncbi:hypothetical protein MTO96_006136 [Rhipicephalus appendiculatus]